MKFAHRLAAIILSGMCVLLVSCGQSAEAQWQEQYDLGVRYLSEGNYEEAVIAFTAAIEIDPKRAEAFIGRGDAYVRSGEENLISAIDDYREAAGIENQDIAFWFFLGELYTLLDNPEKELTELLKEWSWEDGYHDLIEKLEELRIEPENVSREYDADGNLTKETYSAANGELVSVAEYDSYGRKIKATYYKKSGKIKHYERFEYDEQGNMIKVLTFNDDRELQYYNTYTYDSHGVKVGEANYDGDDLLRFRYWFDENGMITRMRIFNEPKDGSVLERIAEFTGSKIVDGELEQVASTKYAEMSGRLVVTTFDENGKMVYQVWNNSDGMPESYEIPEYDIYDNLILKTEYNADGTVRTYTHIEYDIKYGRRAKLVSFFPDGTVDFYEIYDYFEDGQSNQVGYTADDILWYVMEHHPDGKIDRLTWYNEDGSLYYTDEYDDNGFVSNRITY